MQGRIQKWYDLTMDNSKGIDYLDEKHYLNDKPDQKMHDQSVYVAEMGVLIEAADVPTEMMFHVGAITEMQPVNADDDPVYELRYSDKVRFSTLISYVFSVHPKEHPFNPSGFDFVFDSRGEYIGYYES